MQVQRRFKTTGLIVGTYRIIQEMVIVVYDPEQGSDMTELGVTDRSVALWKARMESSKL